MEIITRKEAIELGLARYFTGEPCKNGHVAQRMTKSTKCHECRNLGNKRNRKRNPETIRARNKRYYSKRKLELQLTYSDSAIDKQPSMI